MGLLVHEALEIYASSLYSNVMSSFGFVSKAKYLLLEKENEELKKKITVLQKKIENLTSAYDKTSGEAKKTGSMCKQLQGDLQPLKAENSELRTKVQSLTEERELFQKLIRELTHKAQRQKREV